MKRQYWMLAAIIIAAGLLRLPSLLHSGLWRDEAYLYVETSAPSFAEFFHRFSATEYFPPLYFVLMFFWTKVAGYSEVTLKLPSYLFSLLAVAATYRLGRIVQNAATGLLAALLVAILPLAIAASADARPYSLLALIVALLAGSFFQLRAAPNVRHWIQTAFLALLGVATHYLALLAVAALVAWAFYGADRKRGAQAASAVTAGALPFLLWLPVMLGQLAVGIPWKTPVTAMTKAGYFGSFIVASLPGQSLLCAAIFGALLIAILAAKRIPPGIASIGAIFLTILALESAAALPDLRYAYPFSSLASVFAAWVFLRGADSARSAGMIWKAATVAAAAVIAIFGCTNAVATAAASATPHSGMKPFAAADPPRHDTLYVIAPDYMAATFFYYSRGTGAPFVGFVRLQEPQFFQARDYENDWKSPTILTRAECAIASRAKNYRELDLLADPNAHDQWHVPYSRTWDLLAFLRSRYALVARASFRGSEESVDVNRFRLVPARARNLQCNLGSHE